MFTLKNIDNGKYILGAINSSLLDYYFRLLNSNTQVSSGELNSLPIPKCDAKQQKPIITLVDKILAAKTKDPDADTSAWEREIDELVYDLYGLTKEEREIVEGTANKGRGERPARPQS